MSATLMPSRSSGSLSFGQEENQSVAVSTIDKNRGNFIIPEEPGLPANFGEVVQGVYRSSFPEVWNLPALKKLGLKVIITLVDEAYPETHKKFLQENGITHCKIPIQANKDPNIFTPESTVINVLKILLDRRNHPVLVHCNRGKHRTGCIVGCFRKVQGWSIPAIIAEYVKYSEPKSRALDINFIESFDHGKLSKLAESVGASFWSPSTHSIEDGPKPNSGSDMKETAASSTAPTPFLPL
ncbi:tyrosine phosphatase [Thermoascus aurantiacus ATCC 26904]